MKNSRSVKSFILGVVIIFLAGISQAAPPSIMLSGVMQSQDGPAAYIDGKLLHIGDKIDGYDITSIRHVGITIVDASGKNSYFVPVANPSGITEIEVQKEVVSEVSEEIQETVETATIDEWQSGVSVMSTVSEESATESTGSHSESEFSFDMENPMLIGAIVLIGLGFLVSIVASIWYLVACFQESIWWGLGAMFVPFVELIFLFMHWDRAKKPFLLSIVGTLLMVASAFLDPELLSSVYDY